MSDSKEPRERKESKAPSSRPGGSGGSGSSGSMPSAGRGSSPGSGSSSGSMPSAGRGSSPGSGSSSSSSGSMPSAGRGSSPGSSGSSSSMPSAGRGSSPGSSSGSAIPLPRPRGQKEPPRDPLGRRVYEGLKEAAFTNLGLKLLSLILALTVFLLVNSDRDREITLHVGVSYTLPDDKVLVSERIPEMRVTVRGPWRRLRRFDERELDRVNLDLTRAGGGDFPITNDMVRVPSGLSVVSVSPRSFRVAFEKRVDKTVAVTVPTSGRPLHGYVVTSIMVTPPTVPARGAQGVIAALSAIRGRDVRVDGRSDSFEVESELISPEGVDLDGGSRVTVRVEIKEELVSQRVGPLPIQLRGDSVDPAKINVRPAQVDVVLTGALLAVEHAIAAGLTPTVKLQPGQLGEQPVTLESSMPGVGVTIAPAKVRVTRR